MKDSLHITIPSHPKYLSVVRAVTSRMGELYRIEEATIEDMKLAVDEACTNVIKHAYKGDTSRKIILKYKITPRAFHVFIEDSGMKAQMEKIKGRSLDDIRPGGLGVHFIRRVFDVYEFDEKRKTGNRLKLIKYMSVQR
jgi:serine/threonine-protein kinase RsbW